MTESVAFRAETRQLLDILIHSLYTEREVFLRELISNASDALTRINFELLTNRDVLDPDVEPAIWITTDPEARTLTIRDTGIGMTRDEMIENLGTIAHSGARDFLNATRQSSVSESPAAADPSMVAEAAKAPPASAEIIGQFGVGFYSAFMVADSIQVESRSYLPDAPAIAWESSGEDTYTLSASDKAERGTTITIHLKEDAQEFAQEAKLREIVRRHSDFVPFPIYIGAEGERANQQTALWRQSPRDVTAEQYEDFYRQFTLAMEPSLTHTHLSIDAPVQLYALLYVPASPERGMFSIRKEDGLKLYARKVLIQEYARDLLPDYLRFVQGVVDSEDLQLNVSREAVQSNRIIAQMKRVLTGRTIDMFKKLAADQPEQYVTFWEAFGRALKEGIVTDRDAVEPLAPLLRFHSVQSGTAYRSLDEYIAALPASAPKKIYYLLGDDERSMTHSPHLDLFRKSGVDVLLLTDPIDSFLLMPLTRYQEHELVNAASGDAPDLPAAAEDAADTPQPEALPADDLNALVSRFKFVLGEKVSDVRATERLIDSPARLVDPEGAMGQEMQRVYRMLNKEYEAPQKVLEINARHELVKGVAQLPAESGLDRLLIEQLYEDALLIEGLHPDPAGMIERIQQLMKAALK